MSYIPNYFHQYFSYGKAEEFLKTLKLRMDSPIDFNDPFEFLPITRYTNQLVRNKKNIDPGKVIINSLEKDLGNSIFLPGIDIPEKLSMITQIKMIKSLNTIIDKFRISCFSEKDNDILMWSHYARKHTGVLITFKYDWDSWENNLIQVKYTPNRVKVPVLDSILLDKDDLVSSQWQRDLLITKAECWSYEKEWRFIKEKDKCLNDENGSYILLNKKSIMSVTLGCCMSAEDQSKIIELCKSLNVGIRYAIPDNKKYSLHIKYEPD